MDTVFDLATAMLDFEDEIPAARRRDAEQARLRLAAAREAAVRSTLVWIGRALLGIAALVAINALLPGCHPVERYLRRPPPSSAWSYG